MFVPHGKFYIKITANDKSVKFKVKIYDFICNDNFQIREIKKDILSWLIHVNNVFFYYFFKYVYQL